MRLSVITAHHARGSLNAAGHYDLALHVADWADRCAPEADDPTITGLAAVSRSYGMAKVGVGAYAAALDVATKAADQLADSGGPETAAALAHLHLAAAFAASVLHDHDSAAARLDEAAAITGRLGDESTMMRRHLYTSETNVLLHRVAVAVEAGQPELAVRHSAGLRVEMILVPERAASWLGDLGRAYATLGQLEPGIDAMLAAERLADLMTRRHPLLQAAVEGMLRRPGPDRVARKVRGLAYRMGIPH